MIRRVFWATLVTALLCGATVGRAQSAPATASATRSEVQLSEARAVAASTVKATGRMQAVMSAMISPRVSGHMVELGRNADGRPLDAGMRVRKGDLLFVLNDTTIRNELAATQATLASAQAALANLKAPTRPERIEQLEAAIREIEVRLNEQKKDEERYARLVQEQTAPAKRLEEARTQVQASQLMLAAAQSRLTEARNGATATEILVAEARIKEVEALLKMRQDDLRDVRVTAPFDGLIVRRMKSVGDYISANPATDVFELVAMDLLEAEVRVPESYFARVRASQTPVRLESVLLEKPLELKVTRVIDEIDAQRGTFAVRIEVPAQGSGGLVPGAFVTAELTLPADSGDVIVPLRAVRGQADNAHVYVARDGRAHKRQVVLGDRLTEGVIVKRGVAPGEQVLLGPPEALADGAVLAVREPK